MIVGWRVASHMRTTMVLDALEMARWSRGNTLPGLTCHSDAGSQFTSIRYGERLAEIGAVRSIGTIGNTWSIALFDSSETLPCSARIQGIRPSSTILTTSLDMEFLNQTMFRIRSASSV